MWTWADGKQISFFLLLFLMEDGRWGGPTAASRCSKIGDESGKPRGRRGGGTHHGAKRVVSTASWARPSLAAAPTSLVQELASLLASKVTGIAAE